LENFNTTSELKRKEEIDALGGTGGTGAGE
jgi:hypothetical protein